MSANPLYEVKIDFIAFYKLRNYVNNFSDNWYPILRFRHFEEIDPILY